MGEFNPLLERNSHGKPIVVNCRGKECGNCEEYASCLCTEQIKIYERLAQYEESKMSPLQFKASVDQNTEFMKLAGECTKAHIRVFELMNENYRLKMENDRFKENLILVELAPTASWRVWSGWSGNHDRRIEGAECSHCGYTHPTVKGSLSNLSEHCPKCNCLMNNVEYGTDWYELIVR